MTITGVKVRAGPLLRLAMPSGVADWQCQTPELALVMCRPTTDWGRGAGSEADIHPQLKSYGDAQEICGGPLCHSYVPVAATSLYITALFVPHMYLTVYAALRLHLTPYSFPALVPGSQLTAKLMVQASYSAHMESQKRKNLASSLASSLPFLLR